MSLYALLSANLPSLLHQAADLGYLLLTVVLPWLEPDRLNHLMDLMVVHVVAEATLKRIGGIRA